jgi:quercetin dioxygenase-like cupin family protein
MSERDRTDDLGHDAPGYALGALEADEARRLELRLMEGDGPLRAEVGAYAAVVEHLDRATDPLIPSPDVRARVLAAVREASRLTVVRAGEGAWEPAPGGMLVKNLLRDDIAGRVTRIVSMRGGSVYPSHRHRETEELYILDGTLSVHGFRLGPGDYCAARKGSVHSSAATEGGCQFLVSASEEDESPGTAALSSRGLLLVSADHGAWESRDQGVAVRQVALDSGFGVATILVRMAAGSRSAVRGRQIYVLSGEARLSDGPALSAGDFCGTLTGTAEVTDSAAGCLLLVLSARGALTQPMRA